ncbi:MAG: helix-turn-helix domain-containing protein [Erysipelotrichaceae bacterium]|nr:helix-turn-helix domain-containing protein [Erysipelotrichaceae bacterium]
MKKLGEKLKKKREEKHLSLEEVSAQTQITLGCINAIENGDSSHFHDDFSYLPYYLRQYGKLLGIPEREMESEIKRLKGDIASVSEKSCLRKATKQTGRRKRRRSSISVTSL